MTAVPSRHPPAPSAAHSPVIPHPHTTAPVPRDAEGAPRPRRSQTGRAGAPGAAQRPPAAFPGRLRRPIIRDNMQIEDYDIRLENRRLRAFQRDLEMKERQGLAVQAALAEHSVTSYVRNLPVEDATYPAI